MITESQEQAIKERIIHMPGSGEEGFITSATHCGYYTIQNLYALCGLEPPSQQKMMEIHTAAPHRNDGLSVVDELTILSELGFPGITAIGAIPHGFTARDIFPHPLDAGIRLLIGVFFQSEIKKDGAEQGLQDADFAGMPVYMSHTVVPYAYDDDGLSVIVGWDYLPTSRITYRTIPALAGNRDPLQQPVGIAREFLMVLPINSKAKEQ